MKPWLLLACLLATPAFAYDANLMQVKGFSRELTATTVRQQSRQEWKQPAPLGVTAKDRFYQNLRNNNWTDSLEPFGETTIQDN
jgi:hypothetical protein